jgi:predicted nucleotidyltransferase
MSEHHERFRFAGRRQEPAIRSLADHVEHSPYLGAAVLVGSFAEGKADDVSDVDLFLITREDQFSEAWKSRHELHVTGALVAWDENEEELVGGHRWLTPDPSSSRA